jgi:hypothetical protein
MHVSRHRRLGGEKAATGEINMTSFLKSEFHYHGGYLTYQGKFVARFKYVPQNVGGFRSFLIKNFTAEEYFDRYDAGEAPQHILESKGYLSSHIKGWLAQAGLPKTREGYEEFKRLDALKRDKQNAGLGDSGGTVT